MDIGGRLPHIIWERVPFIHRVNVNAHDENRPTSMMYENTSMMRIHQYFTRRPASANRIARREFQAGLRGDVGL